MSNHLKNFQKKEVNKDIKSIFKLDSAKNIADKLLNGQGDPNMVGGSGALGLIGGVLGGVAKTVGKIGGGFANTVRQYMPFGKAKPKFPNMSARDKKFFNADGSSRTGDLYASATDRAINSTSNFRPLITGNKVYDRRMINDAFAQRFGTQPQLTAQNVIKQATEGKDALTHLKTVKKMASNAGPKNSVKGLSNSPKKRTNFNN